MALSEKQLRTADNIDRRVKQLLANGANDVEILVSMYDHMNSFKQVIDTTTEGEINQLCLQYTGFYKYSKIRSNLAQAIADGSIRVPPPVQWRESLL